MLQTNLIYLNATFTQIRIPFYDEADVKGGVGHYFMVSVNIRDRTFELLDSLEGTRSEQIFFRLSRVLKKIWKEAYRKSNNEKLLPDIDDFSYCKINVPNQGQT